MTNKFKIQWCSTCNDWFIECPRCGNNTCNGGYGEDGCCPVCPDAYDLMYNIQNLIEAKNEIQN